MLLVGHEVVLTAAYNIERNTEIQGAAHDASGASSPMGDPVTCLKIRPTCHADDGFMPVLIFE